MDKLVKYKLIRRVFFASIIVLMACNHSAHRNQFTVPDTNDIKEIVKAVAAYDSLANDTIPISVDLRKFKISVLKSEINILPPMHVYRLNIETLISSKSYQHYFSKSDSLYLLFQNDTLKSFKIANSFLPHIRLTTFVKEELNRKLEKYRCYYEMSIPIFSASNQKAYVTFDHYCDFFGFRSFLFLEKINGEWKVKKQIRNWQS